VKRIAPTTSDPQPSGRLADRAIWEGVAGKALCADRSLDPDEWFPVSPHKEIPRRQAAHAIAVCIACPARAECLELSLQHWYIGQPGVWGGLVAAERAALRRQWLSRTHVPNPPVPIVPCHHSSEKAKAASRRCVVR
jgi:Transcription factor WhiB